MEKRAFVISPIGDESSPIRDHADTVYRCIIQPAMKKCEFEARRSDHIHEPGKISDQMFREILNSDLCIAVLTSYNPNVFYELAIAQAYSRPVIILIEKDHELPFDIQDLRCVTYDFDPIKIYENVYVDQVVSHVTSLENAGWKVSNPFGISIPKDPIADQETGFIFVERSKDFGHPESWLAILEEAETSFDIMGINLSSWRRTGRFAEVMQRKLEQGCKVRILIMHPDNQSLKHIINDSMPEVFYDHLIDEINVMREYFSRISSEGQNFEIRQVVQGTMHGQLTRTDKVALYIPYFYSERPPEAPLWRCAPGASLYTTITHEFDVLWSANETA